MDEFYRLCDQRGWSSHNPPPARIAARDGLKLALIQQFGVIFGTELNSLRSWQLLCLAVGLEEIPKTVPECRKVTFLLLDVRAVTDRTLRPIDNIAGLR